MRFLNRLFALLVVLVAAFGFWVYSGSYDIAADAPHWRVTSWVLEQLRDRSIIAHAPGLSTVPNLDDKDLTAKGAKHYGEMCTGCHLAPGMDESESELRQGLYPKPPDLSQLPPRNPAQQFWIIKHGVKLSGMPAWGSTHDDQIIWGIVAFLQKLPKLSPEEYRSMVGAPAAHHHDEDEDEGESPSGENPGEFHEESPKPNPDSEPEKEKKGSGKRGNMDTTEPTGAGLYVENAEPQPLRI